MQQRSKPWRAVMMTGMVGAGLPVRVFGLEVATGRRRLWREIVIPDATGLDGNVVVAMSRGGRSYAYSFWRGMGELYLAEGLE